MKLKTHTDDVLIPAGYVVREHDVTLLDPTVVGSGKRWVALHDEISLCEWYSWEKSYPAAVLASRCHASRCVVHSPKKRRTR